MTEPNGESPELEEPTMTDGAARPNRFQSAAWQQLAQIPEVHRERYWPAYVALAVATTLQLRLPSAYDLGPKWLLPTVEAALLAFLALARYLSPKRQEARTMQALHMLTLGLIALISADNLASLGLLIRELLRGLEVDGRTLVLSGLAIWVTNVIVFALWYWELDGGGPAPRRGQLDRARDFLFPQIQLQQDELETVARDEELVAAGKKAHGTPPKYVGWLPDFVDYLYVSYTNATAFSPTDTMPLTRWAKMLMLVQSAAALLIVALIAARAVNILK